MAEIVGGFLMPHNPALSGMLKGMADPAQEDSVFKACEAISARLTELRADTVIIISDDHYTNFGPHCIPSCLIAVGDLDGPIEDWIPQEKVRIPNHEPLARHILAQGAIDRIDWSFAKALTVEHAISIPYEFAVKSNPGMLTIPIYLNCTQRPFIGNQRAYEIGQSIRRAVESWPGKERVVIMGTGGMSHWVGMPRMGQVNAAFDHRVLDMFVHGDVDGLLGLTNEEILRESGNGGMEIKNWFCALGALPGAKGEVIAYEAMEAWLTGMGFAELKSAA